MRPQAHLGVGSWPPFREDGSTQTSVQPRVSRWALRRALNHTWATPLATGSNHTRSSSQCGPLAGRVCKTPQDHRQAEHKVIATCHSRLYSAWKS